MQVQNYLRLALVLSDNNAQTLKKNLERMIALVIYDSNKEKEELNQNFKGSNGQKYGLEISDIISRLKNTYGLEFSDNEVIGTIRSNSGKTIIRIPNSRPPRYNITPSERSRIDNKVDDSTFDKLIDEFLDYESNSSSIDKIDETDLEAATENISIIEHGNNIVDKKSDFSNEDHMKFKNLLYQYFYALFNSNASVMQSFLGRGYDLIKLSDTNFNDAQKRIINSFLYWKNPEKDKFVFQMVSCCFDYCVMTAGKTTRSYSQVFNQKVFYLDTNVVFRLMGLNRENRRRVIDAFINKCIEVGITIKVTNFTIDEINKTIDYHVNNIQGVLSGNRPIDRNIAKYYVFGYCNQGFYEAYDEWCMDQANTIGDYASFKKYLRRKASNIINCFKRTTCESYKEKQEYEPLVQSLLNYKQKNGRNSYEESAKVDVNNYLLVRDINARAGSTTFLDTHHYVISTDHVFGDWARELRPGTVPIVVLPSVWYSIILQYAGRNTDDYTAFTRFLNFSLGDGENSENGRSSKKLLIFKRVLARQEPNDIKNDVLFDIEEKLKNNEFYLEDDSDEEVDSIVESGFESVTQRRIAEARAEEQRTADAKLNNFKTEVNTSLNAINNKHEAELNTLREKYEHTKEDLRNIQDEKRKNMDHEITKRTKQKFRKYIFLFIIILVGEIAAFCLVLYWLNGVGDFSEKNKTIYNWITVVVGLLSTRMDAAIVKGIFCGFDKEKIRTNISHDVEDEYR